MRVSGLDLVRSFLGDAANRNGRMDVIPNWYHYSIHYIRMLDYVDWFRNSVSQVFPNAITANGRCPILPTLC